MSEVEFENEEVVDVPDFPEPDDNIAALMYHPEDEDLEEEEVIEEDVEDVEEVEEEDEVESLRKEIERIRSGFINDLAGERERRRKLEEQNQHLTQTVLAELKSLKEADEESNLPDYEEDPGGHLKALIEKTRAETDEKLDNVTKTLTEKEQQEFFKTVTTNARNQEAEFVEEHPDYYDRLQFVRQAIGSHLANQGYDQEQILQGIVFQEGRLMAQAFAEGKNAAELVYNMSEQLNYQPNAEGTEEVETPVKTAPRGSMKQLKKGAKSKSLSTTSGQTESSHISLEEFMELDESVQSKVIGNPSLWKKLMTEKKLPRSVVR